MIMNDAFVRYVLWLKTNEWVWHSVILILKFLSALHDVQTRWSAIVFDGSYNDAKQQSADFATYKETTKHEWVTEKQDIATLFGNIQTKLRTYGLREYSPPSNLAQENVDNAWNALLESEAKRSRNINAQIRESAI